MSKGYRIEFPDPQIVSTELVRELMPQMVDLVAEDARQRAPRRTGKLRNSIEGRTEKGGLQGVVAATARHAHLVHEGTTGHPVVVKQSRALTIPSGGQIILRSSAQIPGARAQPFLREALEENTDAIAGMLRHAGENALAEAIGK